MWSAIPTASMPKRRFHRWILSVFDEWPCARWWVHVPWPLYSAGLWSEASTRHASQPQLTCNWPEAGKQQSKDRLPLLTGIVISNTNHHALCNLHSILFQPQMAALHFKKSASRTWQGMATSGTRAPTALFVSAPRLSWAAIKQSRDRCSSLISFMWIYRRPLAGWQICLGW